MKTREEIEKAIADIKADERMKGERAMIQINAPLALVQCNYEGQLRALKWVLDD